MEQIVALMTKRIMVHSTTFYFMKRNLVAIIKYGVAKRVTTPPIPSFRRLKRTFFVKILHLRVFFLSFSLEFPFKVAPFGILNYSWDVTRDSHSELLLLGLLLLK